MEKIKILFITASVTGGGAERMQINIINSLPLSRYHIQLLSTATGPRPPQLKEGVDYITCRKPNASRALPALTRQAAAFRPHYLFTTSFNIGYQLVLLKYLLPERPRVIVRIAVPPSEYPSRSLRTRVVRTLSRLAYHRVDTFVAQTPFSKQDMITTYRIDPHKIQVIRNILDLPFLDREGQAPFPAEYTPGHYNIVASGALYSIKGFDLLIEAFRQVAARQPRARLYILGDERGETGYRNRLAAQIRESRLEERAYLLGYKQNPYPYYKHADLFVLSSRKEAFPNVVLEALYYHTPVVATDCVDFTGVITDGINGSVVARESAPALEAGILRMISRPAAPAPFSIQNYNYQNLFR